MGAYFREDLFLFFWGGAYDRNFTVYEIITEIEGACMNNSCNLNRAELNEQ